jgi:hypothetical protein
MDRKPQSRVSLRSVADKQVLYLTTIGRTTGLPRQIEIWFVVCRERFYVFAERPETAGWVKKHQAQSQGYGPDRRMAN